MARPERPAGQAGIVIEIPGQGTLTLSELVLDFTGTLSLDGAVLDGVAERLRRLSRQAHITVITADTFGTAEEALAGVPVEVRIIATGAEKLRHVEALGVGRVAAIGNGRNDVAMVAAAALGIAVVGREGAAGALDLLLHPLRVKATLRE